MVSPGNVCLATAPLPWVRWDFKDITNASTNERTSGGSYSCPMAGCGNKTPIFLPVARDVDAVTARYKHCASACLVSNLNCFLLSTSWRGKRLTASTHMNLVHRRTTPRHCHLPTTTASSATTTARALVRDHVLRLTYTAHDMAPFARDLGYDGPPFIWNEEERRHLHARLDALYFHLYRLSRARRRLHPRHLPHRPPPRQSRLRHLPHQGNDPRLLQRPQRRRHRHRCGPLRRGFALEAKSVRMHQTLD